LENCTKYLSAFLASAVGFIAFEDGIRAKRLSGKGKAVKNL